MGAAEAMISFAQWEFDGGLRLAKLADEAAGFGDGLRVEGDGDRCFGTEIPEEGVIRQPAGEAFEGQGIEADLGSVAVGVAAFAAGGDEVRLIVDEDEFSRLLEPQVDLSAEDHVFEFDEEVVLAAEAGGVFEAAAERRGVEPGGKRDCLGGGFSMDFPARIS